MRRVTSLLSLAATVLILSTGIGFAHPGKSAVNAVPPAFAGHTYLVKVDNGVTFKNAYSADGMSLEYQVTEGQNAGTTEKVDLQVAMVADGVYFVSWLEPSGVNVSHVMDLNANTVQVYFTYPQADGIGGRAAELHTATLAQEQ